MSEYKRIYVPLGRDEFAALQTSAQSSYRHPRDQARFILREALGLEPAQTDSAHSQQRVNTKIQTPL